MKSKVYGKMLSFNGNITLRLLYINKNDPYTEVNLYLIRN